MKYFKTFMFFLAAAALTLLLSCSDGGTGGDGDRLPAPSGLKAEALSMTGIRLSWSPVSGARHYNVYRAEHPDSTCKFVNRADETTFIDSSRSPGTAYYYQVTTTGERGESAMSGKVSATTIDCPIPAVPTNVAADVSSPTRIRVSWDSIPSANLYRVYHSTGSSEYALIDTTENRTFTHEGLTPSTTHRYRVAAVNTCGTSDQSAPIEATTDACPKPAAPANVTAQSPSGTSIEISWDEVATATSYNIYRSATQMGTYTIIGNTLGRTNISYLDAGLDLMTTYFYRVTALSECEVSERSNYAVAATGCAVKPAFAPDSVWAELLPERSVRVSWNAADGATHYNIHRSVSQNGHYDIISTIPKDFTTQTITGLAPSTTYYYRVSAANTCGDSERSTSFASVITEDCDSPVPSDPEEITATTLSSRSVRITWNEMDSAASYAVFRGASESGTYNSLGRVTSGTTFTDTTATPSTTYFYGVKAYNDCGATTEYIQNSTKATTMCETSIPTNVSASATSSSRITVTWDEIAGAVSYTVYRAPNPTSPFVEHAQAGTNSYTDNGVPPLTTYLYRITAKTALCDVSRMSETVNATTPAQ